LTDVQINVWECRRENRLSAPQLRHNLLETEHTGLTLAASTTNSLSCLS
jgi:hypothetical protein